MSPDHYYLLAADALLFLHVGFVAFVIAGLLLIVAGGLRGWGWVRNPWFRAIHVAAIGYVVVQAWFGRICPLTVLEMALRERAGDAVYRGSFIAHWLDALLYYEAPPWVFAVAYSLFGAAVLLCWFLVRPRPFGSRRPPGRSASPAGRLGMEEFGNLDFHLTQTVKPPCCSSSPPSPSCSSCPSCVRSSNPCCSPSAGRASRC